MARPKQKQESGKTDEHVYLVHCNWCNLWSFQTKKTQEKSGRLTCLTAPESSVLMYQKRIGLHISIAILSSVV